MTDFSGMLKKPQGYIRLILSVVLVLGSIASTPGIKKTNISLGKSIMVDLAVSGGAMVAITLLLAGSEGDNQVAELGFSAIYALFSVIALIILVVFLSEKHSSYKLTVGMHVLIIALGVSIVLWIIELVLDIKDKFC